ncbi:MAG: hypothetical protein PHP02_00260 [Eubacteriales bacterium]|nr:hypothetical protein [Eubacteriales bacterium]
MADSENKLEILSKIARELNRKNVAWAVGGSALLYFKGIVMAFRDIDVMVSEEDAEVAKAVLMPLGSLKASAPNTKYKTKHFYQFVVSGVDIDVMAGFAVINQGREYHFPLEKENIKDCAEANGIRIPLQSVEEWRRYYELMGREDKVKLIDAYLHSP